MLEYFVEQGEDLNECHSKILQKYGSRYTVVNRRDIRIGGIFGLFARKGIEVTFYIPPNYSKSAAGFPGFGQQSYPQSYQPPVSSSSAPPRPPLEFEEAKKMVLAAAGRESSPAATIQQVLNEVRTIKEKLDGEDTRAEDHPSLSRIAGILTHNDFTSSYIKDLLDRARREFSLEDLNNFDVVQDRVLEWIGESITIYRESEFQKRPRIIILVGPTGVGKTTTIAKLAAIYGKGIGAGGRSYSVRIVSIDKFKTGAVHQIKRYGDAMGIPVECVGDQRELKKVIALYSEGVDMIFVDTIGKSPRDRVSLAEMNDTLEACGPFTEVHLALAAITKSSDITEIFRQFEPFGYQSVLITKLDETFRVGNVISALAEKKKSVSYITFGQDVPGDLESATVSRFLRNLEGFRIDREKLDGRFSSPASEIIQWRQ
ncbi:MAG: flagellar biosynthesis protein FlhF [Treponema sp.]|jgi:flagellar biosynthesis protein FlhF|nr:flagellar biosynthesis protein FlhF [Treponema sp.]